MLQGNYTVKSIHFPELDGAQMDVHESGDHGTFAFPNEPVVEMKFTDPENFEIEGPGGTWKFDVTLNLKVLPTEIKANGKVFSPTKADEGTFTATAATPAEETEDTAAKAAAEG